MAPPNTQVTVECRVCHKTFKVAKSQFKYRNPRYCSHKCAAVEVVTPEYREKQRQITSSRAETIGDRTRGKPLSDEHRKKMSDAHKGKPHGGWKLSADARKRISDGHKGNKSNLWKGGITKLSAMIRSSFEYKEWRRKVLSEITLLALNVESAV